MAVSVSLKTDNHDVWGRLRVRLATITFDGSYATGGEAITPGQFSLHEFVQVHASARPTGAAAKRVVQWDPAAKTLVVLQGDNAAAAAGPLVEVPAAADLSTLVVDVLVIGR